jgi:hypothetical protein
MGIGGTGLSIFFMDVTKKEGVFVDFIAPCPPCPPCSPP